MEVFKILRRGDLWMHVGWYKTSLLPPFLPRSSTLSRELYLGLQIGSLQETFKRKSCQESLSPNFFFLRVQFLNYLSRGSVASVSAFKLFLSLQLVVRQMKEEEAIQGSVVCYFSPSQCLHPELHIRIKLAGIKMINLAAQSQAPICVWPLLCSLLPSSYSMFCSCRCSIKSLGHTGAMMVAQKVCVRVCLKMIMLLGGKRRRRRCGMG